MGKGVYCDLHTLFQKMRMQRWCTLCVLTTGKELFACIAYDCQNNPEHLPGAISRATDATQLQTAIPEVSIAPLTTCAMSVGTLSTPVGNEKAGGWMIKTTKHPPTKPPRAGHGRNMHETRKQPCILDSITAREGQVQHDTG